MNHLTLMAMLQSTGDLHRYASSAIDLFVLRSQCLLTKYWTTKKMWGGVGSFKCPSAFHPPFPCTPWRAVPSSHFPESLAPVLGHLGQLLALKDPWTIVSSLFFFSLVLPRWAYSGPSITGTPLSWQSRKTHGELTLKIVDSLARSKLGLLNYITEPAF